MIISKIQASKNIALYERLKKYWKYKHNNMYYIFYSIKLSSAIMRDNSQWSKKGKSIKFTFKDNKRLNT